MEYLDFIVSSLNKPVFFVFGNHNLNEYGLYHKIDTPDKQAIIITRKPGCLMGLPTSDLKHTGRGICLSQVFQDRSGITQG